MPQQIITASDLIHESWLNYRRHWLAYLEFGVWFLVLAVASWGADMAVRSLTDTQIRLYAYTAIGRIPIMLLSMYLTMVLVRIIGAHLGGTELRIGRFLGESRTRFWAFVYASVLSAGSVLGGFLLLVVPAIILYVRFRFFAYSVIIDGEPATQSLRSSFRLTRGRFWAVAWRLLAITVFFLTATSLVSTLALALVGTALGDTGRFFGEFSYLQALGGGDLLAIGVVPQLSLVVFLPMIIAGEIRLWNELKNAQLS
jgi:hypothetical protein